MVNKTNEIFTSEAVTVDGVLRSSSIFDIDSISTLILTSVLCDIEKGDHDFL